MKRILIAVALAAAVLGTAVFEFFYVGGRADFYTARITQIDAFLKQGDAANALDVCRAVERDWDDETGKIYTLLIHDYADNIGYSLSKMRVHLEQGNLDMYYAESTAAKKGLASIKGSEYPKFENIL